MAKDFPYTDGVIAVKETYLLGDKLYKLCEANAEEAFRALRESGFGGGAEVSYVYDYEKLVAADDRDICSFIREYAPTNVEKEYFFAPRDFHNAKAIVKAAYLGCDPAPMFAPEGIYAVELLKSCFEKGDFTPLNPCLAEAMQKGSEAIGGEEKDVAGAEIGIIFERALYSHLSAVCRRNGFLKKMIAQKADMANIMTALRSQTPEYAANNYVSGGKLSEGTLNNIFDGNPEKAEKALDGTEYKEFYLLCLSAKRASFPMTEGERIADSVETLSLQKNRFELKRSQPFLYYVLRRKAQNADVRILIGGLLAGADEKEIQKRLRSVR